MPDLSLTDALSLALQHQQSGQLDIADSIYTQLLQQLPNHPDILCFYGALCHQKGDTPHGIECLQKSIAANPNNSAAHSNLGVLQQSLGQNDNAFASFSRALTLDPNFADAHYNLANILRQRNQIDAALSHVQKAIALNPNDPRFHTNVGTDLAAKGQYELAIQSYQRSLQLNPRQHEPWNNLGLALRLLNRHAEALAAFNNALALRPNSPDILNNRGIAHHELHHFHDAIADFQQALTLDPTLAEAACNLGNSYRAIAELDNALAAYRRAMAIKPSYLTPHSNLLYLLYYHPDSTPESIFNEHVAWASREPVASAPAHVRDPAPNRRLRIGYVGADFNDHCQSFFTYPLLSNHDRTNFEIYIYSSTPQPDHITQALRQHADIWRDIGHLTDAQLADQIRKDQIDILIDLTMHMAHSRLPTFARKPAPLQLTWLAYPGTTGLPQIDYRLTDPYLDPPTTPAASGGAGPCAPIYSEESLHLPHTFWCYNPLTPDLPLTPLPALTNKHITFASLNTFCKVASPTLQLWSNVLRALPDSRMLILAPEGPSRTRLLDALNIDPNRITFTDRLPRPKYLELYQHVDLCLDTFPYNGHTTSLDAYWMGIPVITLAGKTAVSRAGLSQLTNLNLKDLIAHTPQQFLEIATTLAQDLPRLARLRSTLRQRMQNSPLMNAPQFARNLEALYQKIWHDRTAIS